MTPEEVFISAIGSEGFDYALKNYCDYEKFSDKKLRSLCSKAKSWSEQLEAYVYENYEVEEM